MNKKLWKEYYESKHFIEPTSFAKFCLDYIPSESTIIDLGCGNGRDSYYLASKGHYVQGADYASFPKDGNGATFLPYDLNQILNNGCGWNVVYSRFFLHSITPTEVNKLIRWSKGLFMAEFRCVGDEPVLYKHHERNFIDSNALIKQMTDLGYEIKYFQKGRGMAICGLEDPLVGRIVAKR